MRLTVLKKKIDINILDKYYCFFKGLFAFDDFVKSSPATGGTRRAKTEE
jgi:hypothetical protein